MVDSASTDEAGSEKQSKSLDLIVNICPPISFFAIVLVAVGILTYIGWDTAVIKIFEAAESSDDIWFKAAIINLVDFCLIVLCLPGPGLFLLLNGFFFGFWRGLAFGFTAELAAYLTSIWLARTCLKTRVRSWITSNERLHEVVQVCEQDEMGRFLLLMRFLSLPVWVKNYSVGVLDISIPKCILVFIPGDIYVCAIFVYLGSQGHVIADTIRKGERYRSSGAEVAVGITSVIVFVVICVLGWQEYKQRRNALSATSHGEAAPLPLA